MASTFFEVIGQHQAPKDDQLANFKDQLEAVLFRHRLPELRSWREALSLLGDGVIEAARRARGRPVVVFFDELPWMATGGQLSDEFGRLFSSLFDDSGEHEKLVRACASKRSGMRRDELISAAGLKSGGRATRRLEELEAAGFLARFVPWGRKARDASYRLIDEFSLFHLTWIEPAPPSGFGSRGDKYWLSKASTPSYRAWAGYAFEGMCLKHVSEIEAALGIDGMASEAGTWRYAPPRGVDADAGAQVDLSIDRSDGIIHLCELKYAADEFVLTKAYAKQLVTKAEIFKTRTKTRKDIVLTLVTTHGLKPGLWNDEVVHSVVTADQLMG